MPDPPARSPLEHLFLEDPLPVIIALAAAGLVLGWHAMREGLPRRGAAAGGLLLAAAGAWGLAASVATPAEHAERAVRDFVAAVGRGDVVAVDRLLARDATVHTGRETNLGLGRERVLAGVEWLQRRGLESVEVGGIDAWSDGDDRAVVHLTAGARAEDWAPTGSRWVIRVARAPDAGGDAWRIRRLTWVELMGQPPPGLPRF